MTKHASSWWDEQKSKIRRDSLAKKKIKKNFFVGILDWVESKELIQLDMACSHYHLSHGQRPRGNPLGV